jgi:N4-gp56 family major capsid protein
VKLWAKRLFVEALKQTRYAQFRGRNSQDSLISLQTDLQKGPGDRVTIGLRMQLVGSGTTGDSTLQGNEEALTTYSDNLFIDQLRHAVLSGGKMSEQRVPFSIRDEAMSGLRDWWSDRMDASLFNQLAGATTQQTQANALQGTSTDNRFSGMQAAIAPDSNHLILCDTTATTPGGTAEASLSLTTTYSFKLADLDRGIAKAKIFSAATAIPSLRPIDVNGERQYVIFIHPWQTQQLRANTATSGWADINKSKLAGGQIGDNPIVTGMIGVYNNCMIVEDSRVPCVASAVTSSTSYRRSILCGAQAAAIGFGGDNSDQAMNWVEETFDYGNQLGVSSGLIWGLKKMVFNAMDFATLVLSGYAPAP